MLSRSRNCTPVVGNCRSPQSSIAHHGAITELRLFSGLWFTRLLSFPNSSPEIKIFLSDFKASSGRPDPDRSNKAWESDWSACFYRFLFRWLILNLSPGSTFEAQHPDFPTEIPRAQPKIFAKKSGLATHIIICHQPHLSTELDPAQIVLFRWYFGRAARVPTILSKLKISCAASEFRSVGSTSSVKQTKILGRCWFGVWFASEI